MSIKFKSFFVLSVFCLSSLCSTSIMAMDAPEQEGYLSPPAITYKEYVNNYCVALNDDPATRSWKNPQGSLGTWLSSESNRRLLEDKDGNALDDLPFFQVTLTPVIVDENRLRCDYCLPVSCADASGGDSDFSLFWENSTPEEIRAVKKLSSEPMKEYTKRLLSWQQMLKEQQESSNVKGTPLHLIGWPIRPQQWVPEGSFTLRCSRENVRESNFMYLDFNMATNQFQRHTDERTGAEMPDIDSYKEVGQTPLLTQRGKYGSADTEFEHEGTYVSAEEKATILASSLKLKNAILDIHGNCTFSSPNINFEWGYIYSFGKLTLQSPDKNCPIKNIKILAGNNTQPLQLYGNIEFSDTPKIYLECLNAAEISVKYKPLNSQ